MRIAGRRIAGTAVLGIPGGLIALALLLVGGWFVHYRATYHTWDVGKVPDRIDYCGRQFQEGPGTATLPPGPWTYTPAFTIWPAGWQVYTQKPSHPNPSLDMHDPKLPCTMGLVLRQSDHAYHSYGLLGGP